MSFHLSSDEGTLRIIDNHILEGSLRDKGGNYQNSTIDLDQFIGNDDGTFSLHLFAGVNVNLPFRDRAFSMGW